MTFGSFVFQWTTSAHPKSRLGVIASKRIGDAIARATAKRRLRALFIKHADHFIAQADIVIIARFSITQKPFDQLEYYFLHACRQAGLIDKEYGPGKPASLLKRDSEPKDRVNSIDPAP